MSLPEPRCRVRLTEDAVADLHRLGKKDPRIVREVFKKMLLLERSTDAGEPLLGALTGFRKLVVGDRDYRIVWRRVTDESHDPVLEIVEVWAAGARADAEVYEEMRLRVSRLRDHESPDARALAEVIEKMGRLFTGIEVHPEPAPSTDLPPWLSQALEETLHLTVDQISTLSRDEAQALLSEHWSRPQG